MNKWYSLFIIAAVLLTAGCSGFGTVEEPVTAEPVKVANGGGGESRETPIEVPEPKRMEVPRVNQAKVIGVVRELVNSGCIVKAVGTIDGVHFSQLKVTCGDPQDIPSLD